MKVYVVGKNRWGGPSTAQMFLEAGWTVYGDEILKKDPNDVDLVVFTGGADISPSLYGEENISSRCDSLRDQFEVEVFSGLLDRTPKAGICRGGQFFAVMNGDKLIQHHGYQGGYNDMIDMNGSTICQVDVCHHQGFVTTEENGGLVEARISLDHYEEGAVTEENWPAYSSFYPKTNCYCFQPHPEWGHSPTRNFFFNRLEYFFGFKSGIKVAA